MSNAKTHLLALDQGTSSSRAIVFDAGGNIVASAQREFRQIFPKPGWVEHDPREIWESQLAMAREAIAKSGVAARDIAGLGITNQRETTIVWNRSTGEPIGNAIVWQDRRTAPACEALKQRGLEPLFRARTGLVLDAYFSGTKLAWLLDHTSGARAAAERGELAFGTVDSWLIWMLTGGAADATRRDAVHATDASNASRTLLFDIHEGSWSDELLRIARRAARAAGRGPSVEPPLRPHAGRPARRRDCHRRRRRRPAERALRPGLLRSRPGEEHLRHRLLHADEHRRPSPRPRPTASSRRGSRRPPARPSLPPKAASSSAAPWCSGCAMACTRSRRAARSSSWRRACPTTAGSCSCPPSPASARRTGSPTRAAPSSA